jgi:hypothetical protein
MNEQGSDGYESIVEPLKKKYGASKIAYWDVPDFGLLVVAKPTRTVHHKWLTDGSNPELSKAVVEENYAVACTVHPEPAIARKIFEEYPALTTRVTARLIDLAGFEIKELGKD